MNARDFFMLSEMVRADVENTGTLPTPVVIKWAKEREAVKEAIDFYQHSLRNLPEPEAAARLQFVKAQLEQVVVA